MQAFAWDESFETNVGDVDAQHHKLVELINGLGEILVSPAGSQPAAWDGTRAELRAYAAYHFAEEERLMEEEAVDARHAEPHRREHGSFRETVAQLGEPPSQSAPGRERELLDYLVHWLTYHILGRDQSMARQIRAIRNGQSPAQAFEGERRAPDQASRLLLRSVGALLEVLSTRNRDLAGLNRVLEERVAERTRALSAANDELRELVATVERMAMTDSLTGLPNRRYAMTRLASAWATAGRHERGLACLLADADGLKGVNDAFGHEAGDAVLMALGETLRGAARAGDEVCRLGGDEFLVVCPETRLEGAMQLGERLRAAVARMRVEFAGGAWNGSISVGVGSLESRAADVDALLRAADAGVYEAKRRGRNCVAVAPPPAAALDRA
jgi:diguanylate cyclase (GGDEF)-like protein/hemerythrin-like metal-binding protein